HLQREPNVVLVRERVRNEESAPLFRAGPGRTRVADAELVTKSEGGPLHLPQLGEGWSDTARDGGSRGGVAIEWRSRQPGQNRGELRRTAAVRRRQGGRIPQAQIRRCDQEAIHLADRGGQSGVSGPDRRMLERGQPE